MKLTKINNLNDSQSQIDCRALQSVLIVMQIFLFYFPHWLADFFCLFMFGCRVN